MYGVVDRRYGFLEGPWWLHPKLQGDDVEAHSRAPVLKRVVPGGLWHSLWSTLTCSLPNGAPPWDSAACLGTAGHKYQKWVTSRVCRIHMTILKGFKVNSSMSSPCGRHGCWGYGASPGLSQACPGCLRHWHLRPHLQEGHC